MTRQKEKEDWAAKQDTEDRKGESNDSHQAASLWSRGGGGGGREREREGGRLVQMVVIGQAVS